MNIYVPGWRARKHWNFLLKRHRYCIEPSQRATGDLSQESPRKEVEEEDEEDERRAMNGKVFRDNYQLPLICKWQEKHSQLINQILYSTNSKNRAMKNLGIDRISCSKQTRQQTPRSGDFEEVLSDSCFHFPPSLRNGFIDTSFYTWNKYICDTHFNGNPWIWTDTNVAQFIAVSKRCRVKWSEAKRSVSWWGYQSLTWRVTNFINTNTWNGFCLLSSSTYRFDRGLWVTTSESE